MTGDERALRCLQHSAEANRQWLAEFDRLKAENARLRETIAILEERLANPSRDTIAIEPHISSHEP